MPTQHRRQLGSVNSLENLFMTKEGQSWLRFRVLSVTRKQTLYTRKHKPTITNSRLQCQIRIYFSEREAESLCNCWSDPLKLSRGVSFSFVCCLFIEALVQTTHLTLETTELFIISCPVNRDLTSPSFFILRTVNQRSTTRRVVCPCRRSSHHVHLLN